MKSRDDIPPPRIAESTCMTYRSAWAVGRPRTPSRRWAWSESRVSRLTRASSCFTSTGAGTPVWRSSSEPNWASTSERKSPFTAPAAPTTIRRGAYQAPR